jgi:D-threo-aldose 1-dehydrogenase
VKTRALGRSPVAVTALGFGGAPIGNLYHAVDDATAAAAVTAAFQAGVRLFDTAPHYGLGLWEARLGPDAPVPPAGEGLTGEAP